MGRNRDVLVGLGAISRRLLACLAIVFQAFAVGIGRTVAACSGIGGARSRTIRSVLFSGVAPTVTSVAPDSGTAAGGIVVTITGTNFTGVTAVTFGGVAAGW